MNIYTVSFFGHRHISVPFAIEERLDIILHDLINNKEYVEFLVGRDGEFDQLVSFHGGIMGSIPVRVTTF